MITLVGSLWSLWLVVYDHIWNWMAVYKWSHWLSVYYHIVLQFMITLVSSLWSLWLAVYDHRSSLPVQLVPRLRLPLPHTHALSSPALVWTAIISIISIIFLLLILIITLVTLFFGSINLFHLPCLCSSPFSKLIFHQCNAGARCQVSHTCQWRPDEHLQFPGSACCTIPLIWPSLNPQNPVWRVWAMLWVFGRLEPGSWFDHIFGFNWFLWPETCFHIILGGKHLPGFWRSTGLCWGGTPSGSQLPIWTRGVVSSFEPSSKPQSRLSCHLCHWFVCSFSTKSNQ